VPEVQGRRRARAWPARGRCQGVLSRILRDAGLVTDQPSGAVRVATRRNSLVTFHRPRLIAPPLLSRLALPRPLSRACCATPQRGHRQEPGVGLTSRDKNGSGWRKKHRGPMSDDGGGQRVVPPVRITRATDRGLLRPSARRPRGDDERGACSAAPCPPHHSTRPPSAGPLTAVHIGARRSMVSAITSATCSAVWTLGSVRESMPP